MRLLLMRHAKAATGEGLPDHDRPLTGSGERDARAMGRWLADHSAVPERVLCSSALRARQTWTAVAAALSEPAEPSYLRSVYLAGPSDVIDLLRDVPVTVETVLVVGHNPTMEELLAALTGDAQGFPAGAVAVVELAGGWSDAASGRLLAFGSPKDS